jgi:NAD(P)-dependent dehydrogenase (short-subunit alcohol dehydrogenase family)
VIRTVLITGVSGGVGSATAGLFGSEGWKVVGVDRAEPASATPIDAYVQLDIGRPDAGERLQAIISDLSDLKALINNAAIQVDSPLLETSRETWDEVMASNVRGAFLASRAAFPYLNSTAGAIVNVSSVHALATSMGAAAYATSKGALIALTRAMALEFAPTIRVNAVLPGAVDTPMLHRGLSRRASPDSIHQALEALVHRTPLRRIANPPEIAQAVLFLADEDRSSFITGQTLVVDGGALAQLSTE